jgi:uncharacterized protein
MAAALPRILLAGAVLVPQVVLAAGPPPPIRWVTDEVSFLSGDTRENLDARLETYERQTGHQFLVWIGRTTGGVPIEDFSVRAFEAWRVGRKGLDDGLVLFLFSEDRLVRIEVGYGLEGQIPDAIASRIIREAIVPRIQAGDHDGAVEAGVQALTAAAEGRAVAPDTSAVGRSADRSPPSEQSRPVSLGQKVLVTLVVVFFLILFITHPSFAVYLLFTMLSGSGGGSGSRGGRRYAGGGGRSGGGGATGSW